MSYAEEHSQTTLAYRLKWFLGTSRLGVIIEGSDIFFSLVYCLNYVLQTYSETTSPLQAWITVVCVVIFALHFLLELTVSTERLHFLTSPSCFLNLLSMVPVFLLLYHGSMTTWPKLLRLCEVLRVFHMGVIAKFMKTEINQQLFRCVPAGATAGIAPPSWRAVLIAFVSEDVAGGAGVGERGDKETRVDGFAP